MNKKRWDQRDRFNHVVVSFPHPNPIRGTIHRVRGWYKPEPLCGQTILKPVELRIGALDLDQMRPCKKCWWVE